MKPQVYVKPENALKRAEELIEVDKKQRALDTLYEAICNKKNRQWTKTNEQIIKNFLALCVQFKESHMAKDGLHQYKTICQASSNIKSLEEVINNFLLSAEEQAEKAKKTSTDAAAVAQLLADVDDLENINSPESLLLKAVSGESSQDRTDRDLLAPWLKFVWEAYKNCLELLKNNNKVEPLYKEVAKQGFAFCAKYQRKTEFRKLCELIRQHMFQWQKYPSVTSIDLSKPETQNNHLETRLLQLNHAITMELWQEAYKAVEDIYTLMNLSRQKTKPQQMFNYYSSLSLIFWKANNHLFHAATLQKLFVLLREQKKTITHTELTKIGTRLLLATLAIPIPPNRSSIDEALDQDETTLEKLKRLSSLLNLPQPPTRLSLLKDLVKYNVIQYAHPQIRDLYKWLEVDFNPLKLSQSVDKCLNFVDTLDEKEKREYAQYVQPIKEITVTRLVKQIAQIYNTIEIKRFVQLAPNGIDIHALEKLIVDSAKHLDLQVRINHQTKSLHFGNDLYVAQKDELPEGPSIQNMPSEQIRNQLVALGGALQQARQLIYREENKARLNELSLNIANVYRQTHERHHTDLLKRKQLIEKQREMYESIALERERLRNEKKKQEERDIANKKYNNNRMYEDDLALQEEQQLNQQNQANEILSKEDEEINRQIEQANKERREFLERLKKEEKKYDHFVRACHENEIPLIKKFADDDAAFRKKFWDEKEIERIENMKREQQLQAENKERLFRMLQDKEQFEKQVHEVRQEEFNRRMSEFQVQLNAAREKRLLERKEQRKQERRAAYLKQIEDKKKKEEDEKRKREDEERRKKQDEIAEKQRRREREIEEKMAKDRQTTDREKEAESQKQTGTTAQPYRPRAAGGAGFAKPPEKTEETNWRSRTSAGPSATAASINTGAASSSAGGDDDGGSWRTAGGAGDSGRDDRRFGSRGIGGGAGGSENRPPRTGGAGPRPGPGGDSSSRPNRYERTERTGGDSSDSWRRGGRDDDADKQQSSRSKW